ncbi:hypothetical protein FDG94_gp009 [Pseudomonas phage SM1]|uniref:Uncharacterized protein n=2 Tax=Samunavirus TaxID=2560221 RepID=A0A0U3C8J8_9CAUD|nr:hypothetical protein FDG94_gp009 [Pseudomonas phage SM1]UGC97144.1 hypothetical protein [Pseudomonas phage BHU-1]UGV19897.1 hypothetical protein [Pseudomonas phage Pa BHU-15]UIW13663.1 hypothetical protein [Pseudomonas phage Pa BHU-17]WDS62435.1 hypothetical protein UFRH6_4 [Pseudomonas phage UF_RH6]ALT58002.1 hypothetical protein SM1_09 [Pseudomonas phage SM1]
MAKLVSYGHSFKDIPDYTLQQVVIFLSAAGRLEASRRKATVTDLTASIGAMVGGSKELARHMALLGDAETGEPKDGKRKRTDGTHKRAG